ncbi:MAG: hypothetical protein ACI9QC_000057 [Oceanicoccus sp.]|jgi:hypothetical protein
MGLFSKLRDTFTGTRRPDPNTPVLSVEKLKEAILAVNRDSAPFVIRRTEHNEPGDFLAEWKIVDAKWYEIFAKAGLKKVFRIHMKIDEENNEIRAMDREFTVSWRAGVPQLSIAATAFQGQKMEISGGTAYAFTEEFKPGQVYKYRFDTRELKKPLHEAVNGAGWTYRGVIAL